MPIASAQITKMRNITATMTSVNATAMYPPVVDKAAQIDLMEVSFWLRLTFNIPFLELSLVASQAQR